MITTKRLALRPLTQADAADFHALVTRPEVARMLFMFYPEWPLEAARQFISEWAWRGALRFRLAITAENQWIGWIGVSDDPIPEIFYALTAEAAGKGYAAEAVAGFCAFLFDRFNMPALAAGVFTDNPASARVLEKCGFVLESQAMHASKGRDGLSPCFTFHLPRPDLPTPAAAPLLSQLQTSRLRLRPVLASDEAGVVAALNDLAISSWLARVPVPYTKADFAEFLSEVAYPGEVFAIEDAQGLVGIIGAGFELGYWLIPRAHGLGYATEAATAVLHMQFAHDESTVAAGYFEGNQASARVLSKLGFVEIGRRAKLCRADGLEKPHVDLMLARDQFLAATALEILTPRLRLAPLDVERDWRCIARIGGDPRVAPMMASLHSPWPEADVRQWLDRSRWTGRLGFRLGIWLHSGELIGTVGLGGEATPSTAYFLDPAFWGKGLITEAMQAFLPQMMDRFALTKLEADHFADNPASGAVLRKLGFQQTGFSTGTSLARAAAAPMLCYSLTRQDKVHIDPSLLHETDGPADPIEILTPRLRLAPLDVERDWRCIARIGGDPRVAPMTSSHRAPWPEADVRAFLIDSQWQGRPGFRLGIWLEGKLIGAVGIWDDPAETGYFLDPAYWGRGFATEAMAEFLPQMMARFGMSEVIADHCTDNPASGAVLRKLGFERVGEGMGDSLERGPVPITLYRLLAPKVKNS